MSEFNSLTGITQDKLVLTLFGRGCQPTPRKKQWGFITARFLHTLIVLSINVRIESHLGGHWNFCFFRFNLFLELCVWSTIPSRGDDNREIHLLWIHA